MTKVALVILVATMGGVACQDNEAEVLRPRPASDAQMVGASAQMDAAGSQPRADAGTTAVPPADAGGTVERDSARPDGDSPRDSSDPGREGREAGS